MSFGGAASRVVANGLVLCFNLSPACTQADDVIPLSLVLRTVLRFSDNRSVTQALNLVITRREQVPVAYSLVHAGNLRIGIASGLATRSRRYPLAFIVALEVRLAESPLLI